MALCVPINIQASDEQFLKSNRLSFFKNLVPCYLKKQDGFVCSTVFWKDYQL